VNVLRYHVPGASPSAVAALIVLLVLAATVSALAPLRGEALKNNKLQQAPLSSTAYEFIDVVLPASRVPGLVGARAGSLVATYCADGAEQVALVKLLPRRITRTFLVSANTTVLVPELGEDKILPSDIIIVSIPIPTSITKALRLSGQAAPRTMIKTCTWSSFAARNGLGHRIVIHIPKNAKLPAGKELITLGQGVSFSIYFDYKRSPFRNEFPVAGFDDLKRLSKLVGLNTPPIRGKNLARLEAEWNSFLKQLRNRLISLAPLQALTIGPRETIQQALGEEAPAPSNNRAYGNTTRPGIEPLVLIGSGSASRYYHFSLIIANKTRIVTPRSISIYMGYGVYNALLYIRANSTSNIVGAGLQVTITVLDVSSRTNPVVLWSHTYSYWLDQSPRDIYIYPEIALNWRDKPLNITIELSSSSGANPYVSIAVLNFYKVWDKMPTEQTRKAIQILSTGIAKIRDPHNPGLLPPGCERARASSMLDPSSYSPPRGFGGLVAPTSTKSITIDSSMMEGLYYDEVSESSPVLYLDICIHSQHQSATGIITVKVDGVTYASKTVTVSPPYGYAGFTIFLGPEPMKGHGPLITIEHNLPEGMKIYVDAVIEYKYAPEVWKEDSLLTWFLKRSPWFELLLYEYRGAAVGWESSIVASAHMFSDQEYQVVLFKHRVSAEQGNWMGVKSAGITVKPPVPPSFVGCQVRHGEGNNLEKYVGAAATAWGLISTGLEAASLAGYTVPEPISKGAVIANLAITVLRSATEQKTVKMENGQYTCTWSSGLNSYKWVEVELQLTFTYPSSTLGNSFGVSAMANDLWRLSMQYFNVPYKPFSVISGSRNEVYHAFYGRPPDEVIYS